MSAYESIRVQIRLGDLSKVFTSANLYDYVNDEKIKADLEFRKGIKDLETELGKKANEISRLTEELERVEKKAADERAGYQQTIQKVNTTVAEQGETLKKWQPAENVEQPEKEARDFIAKHDTPFESNDVDKACEVIRALLAAKPEAAKPREVSPLLRQRIENAKDVLRQITPVIADTDGNYCEVAGDRFNTVYNTLQELYDVTRAEVQ